MSNKQFLAQMVVFVLLGANVAAYYFFWPTDQRHAVNNPKTAAANKSVADDAEEQEIGVFVDKKMEPISVPLNIPLPPPPQEPKAPALPISPIVPVEDPLAQELVKQVLQN